MYTCMSYMSVNSAVGVSVCAHLGCVPCVHVHPPKDSQVLPWVGVLLCV